MTLHTTPPSRDRGLRASPPDLSEASEQAFHHSLAIAVQESAHFTLVHAVGGRSTDEWVDFPSVRSKRAEWRAACSLLERGSRVRRSSVSKIEVEIRDPVAACPDYMERNAVDMIVLATADRRRRQRLLRASGAGWLARRSGVFTLIVPEGGRYFVEADTSAAVR